MSAVPLRVTRFHGAQVTHHSGWFRPPSPTSTPKSGRHRGWQRCDPQPSNHSVTPLLCVVPESAPASICAGCASMLDKFLVLGNPVTQITNKRWSGWILYSRPNGHGAFLQAAKLWPRSRLPGLPIGPVLHSYPLGLAGVTAVDSAS